MRGLTAVGVPGLVMCASLHASPVPRVLILGLDGVRPEAMERASTPVIDRLMADGCYTDRAHTGDATVSGPGWSSFLTGVWRDKHNVPDNAFRRPNYDDYPHFFDRLKEVRPDAFTVSIYSWEPLGLLELDETADVSFFRDYTDDGDVHAVAKAVEVLGSTDPDAMFVYIADIDVAGHEYGFHPDVPEYIAEIEEVDGQIGEIITALRSRASYDDERWLILMSTDHGGTIDGTHGRNEPLHREIFFMASGPDAARGEIFDTVNQVDIPATAMHHLGIDVDPAWRFDGRVVGLPRTAALGTNLLFNGDAEYGGGEQSLDRNRGIGGWVDLGSMTVLEWGSPDGYPTTSCPGPDDRGTCFFAGGKDAWSTITQDIDVRSQAALIDAGDLRCRARGWFGGFETQRDLARMRVEFLDAHGGTRGSMVIGGVTAADRGEQTGLLERMATHPVPPETRMLRVTLSCEAGTGANDGYADNLSVTLMR